MASTELEVLTKGIQLRGTVHEANLKEMTFEMTLPDGSTVPGTFSSRHFDNIIEAFKGYKRGVKILIGGVGRYDHLGRLQRIHTIEHSTLLDPLDIPARLEELKALRDGWLDGRGIAPPPAGLDWLAGVFETRYPADLPLPYAYPVAEGGLRLEWSIDPLEISLEIDLGRRSGEWHALNLDTDEEESRTLNLDDETAWDWVIDRLTEMAGAVQSD
jgi:hypothetical protein